MVTSVTAGALHRSLGASLAGTGCASASGLAEARHWLVSAHLLPAAAAVALPVLVMARVLVGTSAGPPRRPLLPLRCLLFLQTNLVSGVHCSGRALTLSFTLSFCCCQMQ